MKKYIIGVVIVLVSILVTVHSVGRNVLTFSHELEKRGLEEAVVFSSQALDEAPQWSPDSNVVYVNDAGVWKRIDLNKLRLAAGTWKDGALIGIASKSNVEEVSREGLPFQIADNFDPRTAVTSGGMVIQLLSSEHMFGLALTISRPGEPAEKLWESDLENCYNLVLSPNEKYVAYQCELTGLIVRKL